MGKRRRNRGLRGGAIGGSLVALGTLSVTPGGAQALKDPEQGIEFLAGQMTWGDYGTIAYSPGQIDWADSVFVGMAFWRDWEALWPRFRLGYEVQILGQSGVNNHVEINLPLTIRYRAIDPFVPIQGAALGLGASLASEPPELEIQRKGQSQRMLPYWMAELEFGKPTWRAAPFVRINHRSDGFYFANFDTGSNGVALGLRFGF